MTTRLLRLLPLLAATLAASAAHGQAGPYRVVSRTVLGGEGGWDYVLADAAHGRLFITRGTHVMVAGTGGGGLLGDIGATPGVHGVALVPTVGRGFTSNGRDSSVTIFDLATLRTLGRTKVTGANPDAITYDAVSRRVFTMNAGSSSATAIDPATGAVVGTVRLAGRPEFAVPDGLGHLWVNLEDSSAIEEIDTRTLRSLGHWPLAGCEEPSGMAFDPAGHRLFSVCSNQRMAVVDSRTGRTVTTVEIGDGPDAAAYDAATHTVFSSNGDGTLTVIRQRSPDRYEVVQTLATQRGARTMALDPRTHHLYLVSAEFGPAPAATAENPRPRRTLVPGSFVVLEVAR
jgi:DNA-binding beta-propeller fold protein YncE